MRQAGTRRKYQKNKEKNQPINIIFKWTSLLFTLFMLIGSSISNYICFFWNLLKTPGIRSKWKWIICWLVKKFTDWKRTFLDIICDLLKCNHTNNRVPKHNEYKHTLSHKILTFRFLQNIKFWNTDLRPLVTKKLRDVQ